MGILIVLKYHFCTTSHKKSRLANMDFNIMCCLVLVQGLMSMAFLLLDIDILAEGGQQDSPSTADSIKEEDITVRVSCPEQEEEVSTELFKTRVEKQRKRRRPKGLLFKLAVTGLALVIVLLPYGLAYFCSALLGNPVAYVITKNESASPQKLVILAIRSHQLNRFGTASSTASSPLVIHGTAVVCHETTQEQAKAYFDPQVVHNRSQLLVVDMRVYKCRQQLMDHEAGQLEQLGYGGLVMLEHLALRSSSHHPAGQAKMAAITSYPVITIGFDDVPAALEALGGSSSNVDLALGDELETLLSNDSSEFYTAHCQEYERGGQVSVAVTADLF